MKSRTVILGATAVAVGVASLAIPSHQASVASVQLAARPLALPASAGDSPGDDPAFSLMEQHAASGRATRAISDADALHHLHHLAHLRHLAHERHLRMVSLELLSDQKPYSGRHRQAPAAAAPVAAPAAVTVDSSGQSPQAYAEGLVGSGQYGCLYDLWMRESGWNEYATNPGSGAYGIPQSLPGDKMASAGADWQTDPYTQIRWGVGYIDSIYGDACGAWAHEENAGWY